MNKKSKEELLDIYLEISKNLANNIRDVRGDLVGRIVYNKLNSGEHQGELYTEMDAVVSEDVIDLIFGKFIKKQFKTMRRINKIIDKLTK